MPKKRGENKHSKGIWKIIVTEGDSAVSAGFTEHPEQAGHITEPQEAARGPPSKAKRMWTMDMTGETSKGRCYRSACICDVRGGWN